MQRKDELVKLSAGNRIPVERLDKIDRMCQESWSLR